MSVYKIINIYRNDYDLENYLTAKMQQTAIQNATESLANILACSKKADIISKAIGICYASIYIFAKHFAIHGYEIHENIRRSQKSRYNGPNFGSKQHLFKNCLKKKKEEIIMTKRILKIDVLAQVYQTIEIEIPDDLTFANPAQFITKMNALYRDMPMPAIEEMTLVENSDELDWGGDWEIIEK